MMSGQPGGGEGMSMVAESTTWSTSRTKRSRCWLRLPSVGLVVIVVLQVTMMMTPMSQGFQSVSSTTTTGFKKQRSNLIRTFHHPQRLSSRISRCILLPTQQHQQEIRSIQTAAQTDLTLALYMGSRRDDDGDLDVEEDQAASIMTTNPLVVVITGMLVQPIVWISLYFVATTGGGLPAGPFGLVGAMEGLSYLVVVGLAISWIVKQVKVTNANTITNDNSSIPSSSSSSITSSPSVMTMEFVERLSLGTIAVGLLTLLSLVVDQGCVPNAKPLIDYSNILPVCSPEITPGLFGG